MTTFLLAIAGLIAWIVSTLAGGGGALLMIPVVHFLVGARAVAPVVTMATLVATPTKIYLFRRHINWTIVRWHLPGALVGAVVGAYVFSVTHTQWLEIIIGLFLISTIFQYRFGEREKTFQMKRWAFLPVGFVVSFISGIIGGAGPLLNPFYLNYGSVKEEMVGTRAFIAFLTHLTKLGAYTGFGAMTWAYFGYGLVIGAAAMVGIWLGQPLLREIRVGFFRKFVVVIMVISGIVIMFR